MKPIDFYQLSEHSAAPLFQEIAQLHKLQLRAGILAELNIKALARFYRFVASNPKHSVLVIATTESALCGFICGTLDLKQLHVNFIKRHPITVCSAILFLATKPKLYKRVGSLVKYMMKPKRNFTSVKAELLSMAVRPSNTRSGVGKCLLQSLTNYFTSRDIFAFKVISSDSQQDAHAFYRSMGGQEVGRLEIGLLESAQYVFDLEEKM